MDKKAQDAAAGPRGLQTGGLLSGCRETIDKLYAQARAKRFGLTLESFAACLERSALKHFCEANPRPSEVVDFLNSLHLEDLVLACACAEGLASAWEEFVAGYRSYLRACAAAMMRCSAEAPEAKELADSLFAELYGLADGKRAERSLFRYFHGRSSLKTWLRAVLAQRHVDVIRAARKFDSLEVPEEETKLRLPDASRRQDFPDPDRTHYLQLFQRALEAALQNLEPRDAACLRLYYAEEKTLAEIGRQRGEHESSVSRNLERIRRDLRVQVEQILRGEDGAPDGSIRKKRLSEEQIALCFEYAAADVPIDLDQLFRNRKPGYFGGRAGSPRQRRET
jgi:RNA polymerase sigma-70 factor, ECF subfamily